MFIRLCLLWMCLSAAALAQNVRITWIGQSGFLIQTENGPAIISDPAPATFGFINPTIPIDAVTVSHGHSDHTGTAIAQGMPTIIDGRNAAEKREQTAAGSNFTIIPGFHDANTAGTNRNSLITWTQGGIKFMQGGDYGQASLTDAQKADLGQIDVAFIAAANPVFSTAVARNFVSQLGARVTILCHYRTPLGGAAQLATYRDFAALYANARVVFKHSAVTITKDQLPTEPEVWVMTPTANSVTVNSGTYQGGVPMSQGSLASIFGNWANATTGAAASLPLPTTLGNVEVVVNGRAAPLLYVSPTQINFQVSNTIPAPNQVLAEIKVAGATVGRAQVNVTSGGPGILTATDVNYRLVSGVAPIRRGEPLVIWATGHGELTQTIDDGQPAPNATYTTKNRPRVTIGGVEAEVLFSGLAPGLVGVWQINVRVANDTPLGADVPVAVTEGLTSNAFPIGVSAAAAEQVSGMFWHRWSNLRSWFATFI
jgi:uncharacterized protein (TIGR03437 family)